jgi:hypothetical protein
MKKLPMIAACFLTTMAMSIPFVYHAWADRIDPEHSTCHQDDECTLIAIGCVLPCIGKGTYDSVNKTYAPQYKHLEACTRDEVRRAAQIGCMSIASPVATCESGKCVVKMKKAVPQPQ